MRIVLLVTIVLVLVSTLECASLRERLIQLLKRAEEKQDARRDVAVDMKIPKDPLMEMMTKVMSGDKHGHNKLSRSDFRNIGVDLGVDRASMDKLLKYFSEEDKDHDDHFDKYEFENYSEMASFFKLDTDSNNRLSRKEDKDDVSHCDWNKDGYIDTLEWFYCP